MKFVRFASSFRPIALAAFGLAALGAQAAIGLQVTKDQEAQIRPGMSLDDVRGALGQPASHVKYGSDPGPTCTYRVAGGTDNLYDVDFGADGRVLSAHERTSFEGGGHGGHGGGR
jgi:hypothetical protein